MYRKLLVSLWLALVALLGGGVAVPEGIPLATRHDAVTPRFAFIDAYVDSGDKPLAAYQFELTAQGPGVTLVGVEGGDAPAFADAPYYDPKANLQNRIVIAAFNTGSNLPHGRTRVARVMVRLVGAVPAKWSAKLDVAASTDATPIPAQVHVSEGEAP